MPRPRVRGRKGVGENRIVEIVEEADFAETIPASSNERASGIRSESGVPPCVIFDERESLGCQRARLPVFWAPDHTPYEGSQVSVQANEGFILIQASGVDESSAVPARRPCVEI